MAGGIIGYVFQFLIYTLLLWLGFDQAGMDLPGVKQAPWLWTIVAAMPLIPWQWSGWEGNPSFWGDGCDMGDGGD